MKGEIDINAEIIIVAVYGSSPLKQLTLNRILRTQFNFEPRGTQFLPCAYLNLSSNKHSQVSASYD